MNNRKLGNEFESELCKILFNHGFWCHNLAQNQAGQPADVIAAKNGIPYLIDCKVCSNRTFSKTRIEENQWLAMTLWQECGNGSGWFAVKFDDRIYMIALQVFICANLNNLSEEWFCQNGVTLEDWLSAI